MWLKFKQRRLPDRIKHRQGLIRLFAFGSCIGLVCAGLSVRAARAEVQDQTLVVGRQMLTLSNAQNNEVHKVVLNGQTVFVSNALSNDDAPTVIGRYRKHCEDNAAQSADQWRQVADSLAKQAEPQKSSGQTNGIIQSGDGVDEGAIVCFVKSENSKSNLGEAIKSLSETGELGAFGQMRYVYVKKGKSGRTHILAAWTLDKFNINEMMPKDGSDVPGEEFQDIPRPDDSLRTFAIRLEGTPFGVNVYESNGDPNKIALAYDAMMVKKGWFALDLEGEAKRNSPRLANAVGRIYEKDGAMITVINRKEDDGKTTTGIGLAGNRAHDVALED